MGFFDRLLGRKPSETPQEIYRALRAQILSTGVSALGSSAPASSDEIVAALMEWNLDGTVVTVVAVADGTVSLYFSNGGGIIGAGAHAGPRQAAAAFLRTAAEHRDHLTPTLHAPLPGADMTRFHVRTAAGDFSGEGPTEELGEDRHALSPLFHAGQQVITAVRTAPPAP